MIRKIWILTMAVVVSSLCAFAYADADTPGSSTDTSALKGVANQGSKTTYVNVHNGKTVNASSKVAHTDAVQDSHPFMLEEEPPPTEPTGGDET